jgi:hypothetical protein
MIMKPVTFTLLFTLASSYASLLIPRPKGQYGTNVAVTAMTDTSRIDPFAPTKQYRSVVVSAFYPVAQPKDCEWEHVHEFPTKTAEILNSEVAMFGVPNGTFEKIETQICKAHASCRVDLRKTPVVTFSPGLGLSRLWYSALAQSVASFGFIVVTVDSPYSSDVVEFPDGRIITAINSTWDQEQSALLVNVTADDASFVLDELSAGHAMANMLPDQTYLSGHSGLSTHRAGIFGHSIGGATAAMAMYKDSRFVGGVNLDGGLYGPVIKRGLQNPFMLFGHKSNGTSPTWIEIWPHLNWKLDIEILNSTHTTFTDIPLLADLIFGSPLPPLVQGIVGHIPGERARDIITAYVVAFMKMALQGQSQPLLRGPSAEYPEIEFDSSPSVQ